MKGLKASRHTDELEPLTDGGVAIGAAFAGESMFFRVTDGSKVALVALVERLRERGYNLFDVQMQTEHTARMGAITSPGPNTSGDSAKRSKRRTFGLCN